MHLFNKLSLRLRFTLLTTSILLLVAVVLTAGSITRADSYFIPDNYLVEVTPSAIATVTATEPTSTDQVSVATQTIPMDEITVKVRTEAAVANPLEQTYQLDHIVLTEAAKKDFSFSSTWLMLIIIALAVLLTWFMAGRALKPVTSLVQAVNTIDEHNLSKRITDIQTSDELQQLADSFNHMLDKLEQAFAQQKTFSANAAHELKTPLAAIRTNLEVLHLDDTPTLEDYQETIAVIDRHTNRLVDLVNNLLELNDQQQLNFQEEISTAHWLEQILSLHSAATAEKQLEIVIDNQLPVLYANQQLITVAVNNLIENAVKYHHHNGAISIALSPQEGQAQLVIQDDGPGIAEEQLPHIFEPFYRCDQSRSSKIGGSGLGLALVKTIVQRHHGSITVQSTPQQGTCFTIILPQQTQEQYT